MLTLIWVPFIITWKMYAESVREFELVKEKFHDWEIYFYLGLCYCKLENEQEALVNLLKVSPGTAKSLCCF